MNVHENDQRFRRPVDVTSTRRNRHRVRATRILVFLANLLLVTLLIAGGSWLVRRLQEDERFAIRTIEIDGVEDVRREQVAELLGRWDGANLFRLEMDIVRQELTSIDWVGGVVLEKELPDRLRVQVLERVPEAIVVVAGRPRFIDATGAQIRRCVRRTRSGDSACDRECERARRPPLCPVPRGTRSGGSGASFENRANPARWRLGMGDR